MRPLEGVRILDLSQAYAGPFCTMNLADHGAEVIKIERPGVGDQVRTWGPMKNGESGFHACLNRNKSGITLDLKSEEATVSSPNRANIAMSPFTSASMV